MATDTLPEIPSLTREEITRAVEALLSVKRNRYVFAFLGRAGADAASKPVTVGHRSFEVVPVDSELDLRMKLPELDEVDPHRVFLVPFVELPRDVQGLFALKRVERVGKDERLAAILGCGAVEAGLSRTPLGELLLNAKTTIRPLGLERVATARALVATWMNEHWELPSADDLGRDSLLAWASSSREGKAFEERYGRSTELVKQIERELGTAAGRLGRVAFHAWRLGHGEGLFELAVIAEAGRSVRQEPALKYWMEYQLQALDIHETLASEVAHELGDVVSTAIPILESKTSSAFVRARIDAADARLKDPAIRSLLANVRGERLALQYEAQTVALATALERVADMASEPAGSDEALRALLREAEGAYAVWTRHELTRRSNERLERAEDALRLAIFLESASRDERLREDPMGSGIADLARLARWYGDHGGYVDRARHAARGPTTDRLGAAIARIVARVDAFRVALDRRFARALVEWNEAGRRRGEAMGIEDALAQIAKPFLDVAEDRRLLVILFDGMSWCEASEILDDLAQYDDGWGPLAFNRKCTRDGELPVVLAALPTVTDVSRSAFFLGKRMESGDKHDTGKDPDRFVANKAIATFFSGSRAPRLFLRADAQTKGGTLRDEVVTAVADSDARVVGVVLNTIDDSLKSNPSQRQRWSLASIAPLRDLLSQARRAGRYVLFASDHGHVKSATLRSLEGLTEGEGRRWRRYEKGKTSVAEHETRVTGGAVWTPRGADGLVLLVDDTGRYGASGASGEHGGASLAEVVTPCLLVGWEEPLRATDEGKARDDLALMPRYAPPFWRLRIDEDALPRPEKGRPEKGRKKDPRQLELAAALATPPALAPAATEARPVPAAEPTHPESAPLVPIARPKTVPPAATPAPDSALARSALFKQQVPDPKQRADLLRALAVLEARGGRVPADVFAEEMGYLQHRVAGHVAILGERLALDGMQPLRFDRVSGQVVLDLGLFRTLYSEGS
jgi:hypothetical protein